nr:JmjC domain-containing protein [Tanacetum cinerariifolium]
MPLLAPILVVSAGGDGADVVAAGAADAHDVPPPPPPPIVPPTHSSSSTPGPFTVAQVTPMREPTLVREPTPSPMRESTPDSPRPPFPPPYPRSEEVGPTTSTRPSSPTRQTSFQEDISEGGGDFVSLLKSNEAQQTPAATAAGGAEDSAALTALSLKLDRCIHRVTSLENKLGVTKKVLGGAILKLVTRVKRLEGLLQQRKKRLVLFDSEGKEAATKEQDIDLDALHKLASTSLGGDSTVEAAYTIYKASQDAHASSDVGHAADEVPADTMPYRHTLPAGKGIPAAAPTIPAGSTPIPSGSSMDPAGQAAAAPSSTIPATNKGKAPMVDDSLHVDLLSEQERILKNLHDYQLGDEVASPTEQGTGLSDQRRRELDAAQLIYTEADWLELMAKIATNSALSKQLLGDDVNEDNMNERLGMLLMRKRRELAVQSRIKPMNKTQQRDFMKDFVKNQSAAVYNKGWTMKQVPASVPAVPSVAAAVLVPAAPSVAADVSVPTVSPNLAAVSTHVDTEVHAEESTPNDNPTASEQVSAEHIVAASTPSSSRKRRKQIAKKRVTPIVDIADDALIKFDSASDSDDNPLPYASYAATLQRMLKHGLEVPKLLVAGDLTMAE